MLPRENEMNERKRKKERKGGREFPSIDYDVVKMFKYEPHFFSRKWKNTKKTHTILLVVVVVDADCNDQ